MARFRIRLGCAVHDIIRHVVIPKLINSLEESAIRIEVAIKTDLVHSLKTCAVPRLISRSGTTRVPGGSSRW